VLLTVIAHGGEERKKALYIELRDRYSEGRDCFRWVLLPRAACVGRRRGFLISLCCSRGCACAGAVAGLSTRAHGMETGKGRQEGGASGKGGRCADSWFPPANTAAG
jgi:hypothetical protein